MIWRLVAYLLVLYSLLWIVLCYQNGYLLIFIRACHLHCIWDMVVVRGCSISRVVSRAVMDILFWGTHHAPRMLVLSRVVSCAAIDAWTDISPMGPWMRDSGCVSLRKTCITIFDIASHGITHLLLMNLNTCFADLVSVSLWSLWLLNIELLLRMCKLIDRGYWVVCLVNCKLLGCSVEV